MVYRNNLVCAIKVGGKVLRENDNTVLIPFGSEYSVFLKNINSVRAQVKVAIDGKDATDGTWLVIAPNSSLELERYIRDGNFERGNRFKFIERTGDIEAHRGIGAEDGLVRVEYKAERVVIERPIVRTYEEWYPVPRPYIPPRPIYPWHDRRRQMHPMRGMRMTPSASAAPSRKAMHPTRSAAIYNASNISMDCAFDGITVAGSESNQRFVDSEWFATENHSDVIVLKLRGTVGETPVIKPLTVDRKPTCETCGRTNKANAQFCSKCGTALTLI